MSATDTSPAVTADRLQLAAGSATCAIAPADGGCLVSLRVAGQELLIPRRAGDGPVPTFGSFLMAPWVGELAFGELDFRGRRASIPPNLGRHAVHGLVATGPWQVEEAGTARARLTRRLGPPWPFGGVVTQEFRLDDAGLTLQAEIRAEAAAMPAALGWHPWFAAPDPGVVRVGVQADSRLELDDELLPTGRILPVEGDTDLRQTPVLGRRQIDTVYVGAVSPARVTQPGIDLEIHFDPAIDNIVVFTSSGAVCVEPWSAWPDAFRAADAGYSSGVRVLEPGQSLRRWTRWQWSLRIDGMDNEGARWVPSSTPPLPTE